MGLPRADHMWVKGKELRDPWSFNIWFPPETILIYWPLNMCFKQWRKGKERKRERELFTQYYTLNPSIQIFKRFLLEMLMEDF